MTKGLKIQTIFYLYGSIPRAVHIRARNMDLCVTTRIDFPFKASQQYLSEKIQNIPIIKKKE